MHQEVSFGEHVEEGGRDEYPTCGPSGWMDEWMKRWMDGWMDGEMDKRMDKKIDR